MNADKQRIGWSGKVWRAWESLRGRGGWYVVFWPDGEPYSDERADLLRCTRFRWQATRWVRDFGTGLRTPILVTPHDLAPQYASQRPLYPFPDRPRVMDDRVEGSRSRDPDGRGN
ncbi:hypothetical protein [Streptomyces sp. MS1.AVA.4]|uniref:Uncharacterized protein n=1 Tax=Streptomyces pratisoli TaxID=3139917 RepID=A0ACC6Q9E8_9ACTN